MVTLENEYFYRIFVKMSGFVFTHFTTLDCLIKILSNDEFVLKSHSITGKRNLGGFGDYVFLSSINKSNIDEYKDSYDDPEYYVEVMDKPNSVMLFFGESLFPKMGNNILYSQNWHSPLREHIPLTLDLLQNSDCGLCQIIVRDRLNFISNDVIGIAYSKFHFDMNNLPLLESLNLPIIEYCDFIDELDKTLT